MKLLRVPSLAFRVRFSHGRVLLDSRNVQKSVTKIIYLGPLSSSHRLVKLAPPSGFYRLFQAPVFLAGPAAALDSAPPPAVAQMHVGPRCPRISKLLGSDSRRPGSSRRGYPPLSLFAVRTEDCFIFIVNCLSSCPGSSRRGYLICSQD